MAGASATARLHAALARPSLYQRCVEISKIISDTSSKELHSVLSLLLESIFGFSNHQGWGLSRITKAQFSDFQAVRQLLGPEGPVLMLIYRLLQQHHANYEFPVSCLPYPTRHTLEEGGIPSLYVNKLQYLPGMNRPYNMLTLNAFEYYFFHFTYFLINPLTLKMSSWNNPSDALFPVLLEDYLNYFMPVDGKPLPSMPHTAQPVRSPVHSMLHRSQSPGGFTSILSPGLNTSASRHPFSSLLRHQSPAHSPIRSPMPGQGEATQQEGWRSHMFIQILAEFWLSQNVLDKENYGFTQQISESYLPSSDLVRVVRMVIKHLHYFANSAQPDVISSPYSSPVVLPLEELKRSVFPQLIQKKLYAFLRHGFERWPLDSSFRLMLETWLSYIQPWRYSDPTTSYRSERELDTKEKMVEERWRPFIYDNLLFYTVLFHEFLPRVFRMDIGAPKNAYMLFRVSKVFNIPNLREILEDAEVAMFESGHRISPGHQSSVHDLGASYISPPNKVHMTVHFAELEGPGFQYRPIFSDQTYKQVLQLINLIQTTKNSVKTNQQKNSDHHSSSLLSFIFGSSADYNTTNFTYNDGYEDLVGGDYRKLEVHMDHAVAHLCNIFQIQAPEDPTRTVTWGPTSPHHMNGASSLGPDLMETDDGLKLSPLGRYQLMNGLRKFEVRYSGDPDLQPIRSFESAFLVRTLHDLSSYFNERFSHQIHELYEREDFVGRMAYQFFHPPHLSSSPHSKSKLPLSPLTPEREEALSRPRVSLRWMANYHNIFLFLAFYVFCYMWWGLGIVSYGFLLFFFGLLYGAVMAVIMPRQKQKNL